MWLFLLALVWADDPSAFDASYTAQAAASHALAASADARAAAAEVGAQGLAEQAQQARKEASAICCCLVFDFRMFPKQVW